MDNEVLLVGLLCLAGFISWRLSASNKKGHQEGGFALFTLSCFGYVTYGSLYENWLQVGLALLGASALGFFGKDSLKPFVRQKVKPEVRRTVGTWQQAPAGKKEDDYSDIGI